MLGMQSRAEDLNSLMSEVETEVGKQFQVPVRTLLFSCLYLLRLNLVARPVYQSLGKIWNMAISTKSQNREITFFKKKLIKSDSWVRPTNTKAHL